MLIDTVRGRVGKMCFCDDQDVQMVSFHVLRELEWFGAPPDILYVPVADSYFLRVWVPDGVFAV